MLTSIYASSFFLIFVPLYGFLRTGADRDLEFIGIAIQATVYFLGTLAVLSSWETFNITIQSLVNRDTVIRS